MERIGRSIAPLINAASADEAYYKATHLAPGLLKRRLPWLIDKPPPELPAEITIGEPVLVKEGMEMATRPTGTLAVNETDLHWGGQATFDVTASVTPTYVRLTAHQGDAVVMIGYTIFGYTNAYTTRPMGLSSPAWPNGGADCTAEFVQVLARGRTRTLATINFSVAP